MSGRVLIFDTTLRDGEQSPGASMNIPEKLRMAEALADLGADIIEAGFPIASPGDFEAVRAVARNIDGPIIAGLARCNREDIERAWEAVKESDRPRLHIFLATSAIHREHKLKMAKEEILRHTAESVEFARSLCDDVEFSPEDASRTEPDFLDDVVRCAVQAGATTINIPDTVGYAVPKEFGERIAGLRERVAELADAVLSVHCHDDLGFAVANTIAALLAGARQVECTINGIGERAGNCSLEEVVMALRTRNDFFGLDTAIDATKLYPTSQLLSNITGLSVQRNKAIVGDNAFAHEAGIHQHGMLMHHSTYEIMRPEDVGVGASNLVLGKHSGRHAFRSHVEKMGFELDEEQLVEVFAEFKKLADLKRTVYDADIRALIDGTLQDTPHVWSIIGFQTVAGKGIQHVAEVRLEHRDGDERQEAACGDGPVDSLFKAMDRATGMPVELHDYNVRSVTQGKDAQGEVTVETVRNRRRYRGRAVSTDVIEASADAYMSLVNQVIADEMPTLAAPPTKEAAQPLRAHEQADAR
jgi:2-isopropylmalate synthase